MSESIEALTEKSRDAILAELMDAGRSHTPFEYIARTEITRLTARIAELEKALRDVAEAKMPGLARYIARTTLEASERGGGE